MQWKSDKIHKPAQSLIVKCRSEVHFPRRNWGLVCYLCMSNNEYYKQHEIAHNPSYLVWTLIMDNSNDTYFAFGFWWARFYSLSNIYYLEWVVTYLKRHIGVCFSAFSAVCLHVHISIFHLSLLFIIQLFFLGPCYHGDGEQQETRPAPPQLHLQIK